MKKLATRTVQYPMTAEFVFKHNEWVVDSVDGVKRTFGSPVASSTDPSEPGLNAGTGLAFDCVPMPIGAVISGGEVIVENAYAGIGAGATLSLGIAGNTAALVSAMDLDAAAAGSRTAIALTAPLLCNNGQNIRLTLAGMSAAATAGKVRVRVNYTIDHRVSENVIA